MSGGPCGSGWLATSSPVEACPDETTTCSLCESTEYPRCDFCYSPDRNLDLAYEAGSVGCACTSRDKPTCAMSPKGYSVALQCVDKHWQAVVDGACGLQPAP